MTWWDAAAAEKNYRTGAVQQKPVELKVRKMYICGWWPTTGGPQITPKPVCGSVGDVCQIFMTGLENQGTELHVGAMTGGGIDITVTSLCSFLTLIFGSKSRRGREVGGQARARGSWSQNIRFPNKQPRKKKRERKKVKIEAEGRESRCSRE